MVYVTINFLSSKSDAVKLELVIAVKLSNKIISPRCKTVTRCKSYSYRRDPLVVVKAFVKVVVDLIGCMS